MDPEKITLEIYISHIKEVMLLNKKEALKRAIRDRYFIVLVTVLWFIPHAIFSFRSSSVHLVLQLGELVGIIAVAAGNILVVISRYEYYLKNEKQQMRFKSIGNVLAVIGFIVLLAVLIAFFFIK